MMQATLIGALCGLIVAALARPFLVADHPSRRPATSRTRPPGPLTRQLGDLEEDLAAGRLTEPDYLRLRHALERQAAADTGEPTAELDQHASVRRPSPAAGHERSGLSGRGLALVTGALSAAVVAALLLTQVGPKEPLAGADGGMTTSDGGDSGPVAGASESAPGPAAGLSDVESAVRTVRHRPRDPSAHVALARAYAAVGQDQLAGVEYLAATRLDPADPEANTALALIAFRAGSMDKAEALATRVLTNRPQYPEALYARGLIRAMGLHHPRAATRDLRAYERLAPYGSHRTTVDTVLALLDSGEAR